MKKALVVLLAVVVLVTGLPMLMGMSGMAACHDCGPAVVATTACTVAVLAAGVALALVLLAQHLRSRRDAIRLLLHSFVLERPPRFA